jgi:UDP-N-acetylmuramate dehydrogenase
MINLQKNVLLKEYSNYKIGGTAKFLVEVSSVDELREAFTAVPSEKIYVLGGGTKTLISDKGFDGLVIINKIEGIEQEGDNVRVGSGTQMKDVLDYCIENSYSGLEWAGGLPGTIGGAVRGNAGSFKGETKDVVVQVESIDLKTLSEKVRDNAECKFGYRDSTFKSGVGSNDLITHVILRFVLGDKKEISEKIQQKIDYRINRQPLEYPSIGSTFKNIPLDSLSRELQEKFASFVKNDPFPMVPVTKLLALCDLKGKKVGGAMISDKQPNFIVNIDNATALDVKALIEIARNAVKEKFNLFLEEEVVHLN